MNQDSHVVKAIKNPLLFMSHRDWGVVCYCSISWPSLTDKASAQRSLPSFAVSSWTAWCKMKTQMALLKDLKDKGNQGVPSFTLIHCVARCCRASFSFCIHRAGIMDSGVTSLYNWLLGVSIPYRIACGWKDTGASFGTTIQILSNLRKKIA